MWTSDLVAWFAGSAQFACGVVPWIIDNLVPGCGLIIRWISSLILWLTAALVPCAVGSPILWLGNSVVQQIGCKLLARSLYRQHRLLCACGTTSQAAAAPLSVPGLPVPSFLRLWVPFLRLWMGCYLI